jgi:hypothetical protein
LRTAEGFAIPETPTKVLETLTVFHCVGSLGEERPLWGGECVRHGSAKFPGARVGLTMPKRFSTLRVSMVCSAGTSTRNSECSGLKGIILVEEWRGSCWVPCVAREETVVYADGRYGELGMLADGRCYVSAVIGRWLIYPVGTRP